MYAETALNPICMNCCVCRSWALFIFMFFQFSSYLLYLGTSKGLGLGVWSLWIMHIFSTSKTLNLAYIWEVLSRFKYFLHQLSTFCRSVRQGTYFSITYSKFCVMMPQPKDHSRHTLVARKLQEDASRGYLPLEAHSWHYFKGADTSRDRDEEKCLPRTWW